MKKIYYHKLIRDNIPSNIKKAGAQGKFKKLKKRQFETALIRKVEEEASGMQNAKSKKELVSEIADVIDVIEEIKKIKKIRNTDITGARKANMKRKGGFKKRLYLVWSSDDGYKSNEKKSNKRSKALPK